LGKLLARPPAQALRSAPLAQSRELHLKGLLLVGALALAIGYAGPSLVVQRVGNAVGGLRQSSATPMRAHGAALATRAVRTPDADLAVHVSAAPVKKVEPLAATRPQPRVIDVVARAYCLTGRTASGVRAGPGSIAVDPQLIPLGSRLYVEGYGYGVADDLGGAVRGSVINVWLPCSAARVWGVRYVSVTLLG
jgi:3D (Asp-Asp-Asp) domain-containing protein